MVLKAARGAQETHLLEMNGHVLSPPSQAPRTRFAVGGFSAGVRPQFCPLGHLQVCRQSGDKSHMRDWVSQIIVGIIVTVVGTVIANAVVKSFGGRGHVFGAGHYSEPIRGGR
jgi:hypothetical protein